MTSVKPFLHWFYKLKSGLFIDSFGSCLELPSRATTSLQSPPLKL